VLVVSGYTETPFVLIVDGDGVDELSPFDVQVLKGESGARLVIASEAPIDVATPVELTVDQSEALLSVLAERVGSIDPVAEGGASGPEGWGVHP
jgi:hypothetical protein